MAKGAGFPPPGRQIRTGWGMCQARDKRTSHGSCTCASDPQVLAGLRKGEMADPAGFCIGKQRRAPSTVAVDSEPSPGTLPTEQQSKYRQKICPEDSEKPPVHVQRVRGKEVL